MNSDNDLILDTLQDHLEDIQNFMDCYDIDNEIYPTFEAARNNTKTLIKYYSKE